MFTKTDYQQIIQDVFKNPVTLLVSREGAGKSLIARELLHRQHNVIFLCETNAQASEKAATFMSMGIPTQLVKSKAAKLKEIGVISRMSREHIFAESIFDLKKTLKDAPQHLHQAIRETQGDTFDLTGQFSIVVATIAQRGQIQGFSQSGWLVIMDDPNQASVNHRVAITATARLHEKIKPEVLTVNGNTQLFGTRPDDCKLTHNISLPILFTTTEQIVCNMAKKNLAAKLINDFPDDELDGNIYMFSTDVTRKGKDWLIPVLAHSLDLELIGDGMYGTNAKLNTTKGNNSLTNTDTMIELSIPNMYTLYPLLVEFPEYSTSETIKMLMVDQLNQALGRNQGHRFKGANCYVLADKQYAVHISEAIKYKHQYFKNTDEIFTYVSKQRNVPIQEIQRFIKYQYQLALQKTGRDFTSLIALTELKWTGTDIIKFVEDLESVWPAVEIRQDREYIRDFKKLKEQLTELANSGRCE